MEVHGIVQERAAARDGARRPEIEAVLNGGGREWH